MAGTGDWVVVGSLVDSWWAGRFESAAAAAAEEDVEEEDVAEVARYNVVNVVVVVVLVAATGHSPSPSPTVGLVGDMGTRTSEGVTVGMVLACAEEQDSQDEEERSS